MAEVAVCSAPRRIAHQRVQTAGLRPLDERLLADCRNPPRQCQRIYIALGRLDARASVSVGFDSSWALAVTPMRWRAEPTLQLGPQLAVASAAHAEPEVPAAAAGKETQRERSRSPYEPSLAVINRGVRETGPDRRECGSGRCNLGQRQVLRVRGALGYSQWLEARSG